MQLCKVISCKVRILKLICNMLPFLCVEIPLHFGLHALLKRPKFEMCLKHITPVWKENDKKVINTWS